MVALMASLIVDVHKARSGMSSSELRLRSFLFVAFRSLVFRLYASAGLRHTIRLKGAPGE